MQTELIPLFDRAKKTKNGLDEIEQLTDDFFFAAFKDEAGFIIISMWVFADKTKVLKVKFSQKRDVQSQLDALARSSWFLRDMDDMRRRVDSVNRS